MTRPTRYPRDVVDESVGHAEAIDADSYSGMEWDVLVLAAEVLALRDELADRDRRLESIEWETRRMLASVPDAKQMQKEHGEYKAEVERLKSELQAARQCSDVEANIAATGRSNEW